MTGGLQKITLTIEIEPIALTILQQQADWQGLSLDQLAAQYIGRCAGVVETQHGNVLVADAFQGLVERNGPKQKQPEPEPDQDRLQALEHRADERGYRMFLGDGRIELIPLDLPEPEDVGRFPLNDSGTQAALDWLKRQPPF